MISSPLKISALLFPVLVQAMRILFPPILVPEIPVFKWTLRFRP